MTTQPRRTGSMPRPSSARLRTHSRATSRCEDRSLPRQRYTGYFTSRWPAPKGGRPVEPAPRITDLCENGYFSIGHAWGLRQEAGAVHGSRGGAPRSRPHWMPDDEERIPCVVITRQISPWQLRLGSCCHMTSVWLGVLAFGRPFVGS